MKWLAREEHISPWQAWMCRATFGISYAARCMRAISQQIRCQGRGKRVKLDTFLFLPLCKFISLCATASFNIKLGWGEWIKKKNKPRILPLCSFIQERDLYVILAGISGYQWPHMKHWKRSSTGKKAKTCHKRICNISCCSSTAHDFHLQMAAQYQDSKPAILRRFLRSSWVAGSYANVGSKNLLLLRGKLHPVPRHDCLPAVTPTGRWVPSQPPVVPYSTEHPPLCPCSSGLRNTSDPSATATENRGPTHEPGF